MRGCHSSARLLLLQCGDNINEENREHLDQLKTESDQSALSDGDDAVCRGVGVRPRHPARQGVGRGAGAAAERTGGQEAGAAAAGPAAKTARGAARGTEAPTGCAASRPSARTSGAAAAVCTENLDPDVMVMKSTKDQ